ncbi:DUF4397 domain-containing protein [Hazenella coriacea]|uniref:Uncharacterized protein DUF4397 n=1 Tax=Hazenella coriacea TaxID=1179467 RepID=A0A4R3LEE0_9BACL|nr:DUF4397 domain-containing protein [Hazenella coriacea]TCS95816.1 uncharacterized protein DUF4397 [Hazenella coriacea]
MTWKKYLEKAHVYERLADYYKNKNPQLYNEYYRKYNSNMKIFVEAYHQEKEQQMQSDLRETYIPSLMPIISEPIHPPASVRILHASKKAEKTPVDLYVNGQKILSNLKYGSVTNYLDLRPGEYLIEAFPVGKKDKPLIRQRLQVKEGRSYLLVVIDHDSGKMDLAIYPITRKPSKRKAKVRVIHLAKGIPTVNVTLPTGVHLFKEVSYLEGTPYQSIEPISTKLIIKESQTDQLLYTIPKVKLGAGDVITAIALDPHNQLQILLLNDRR